jgi:hypothetical protein
MLRIRFRILPGRFDRSGHRRDGRRVRAIPRDREEDIGSPGAAGFPLSDKVTLTLSPLPQGRGKKGGYGIPAFARMTAGVRDSGSVAFAGASMAVGDSAGSSAGRTPVTSPRDHKQNVGGCVHLPSFCKAEVGLS